MELSFIKYYSAIVYNLHLRHQKAATQYQALVFYY